MNYSSGTFIMNNIPKVSEVKLHCIVCGCEIEVLDCRDCNDDLVTSTMLDNGLCGEISAGYGSSFDTLGFIISICDNCIIKSLEKRRLIWHYDMEQIIDYKSTGQVDNLIKGVKEHKKRQIELLYQCYRLDRLIGENENWGYYCLGHDLAAIIYKDNNARDYLIEKIKGTEFETFKLELMEYNNQSE